WERKSPPDERNRILLETNCLLVRTGAANVLIDTGYGSNCSPRERENFSLQGGAPLIENLAAMGVTPEDIDWVVLTHLHFDHAGGCTIADQRGRLRPAFPRARYVVQEREWSDATGRKPELAGAYFDRDFVPIQEANQLLLVEGDSDVIPGISTRLTNGHT